MIYGIRPEHIEISPEGIPATISVLEPTGSETQVFARLGQEPVVAVVRERLRAGPGEQVSLKVDGGRSHFFDKVTGRRL